MKTQINAHSLHCSTDQILRMISELSPNLFLQKILMKIARYDGSGLLFPYV